MPTRTGLAGPRHPHMGLQAGKTCATIPRRQLRYMTSIPSAHSPTSAGRAVQELIRSPECAHSAQDTSDPGRKQVPQNA